MRQCGLRVHHCAPFRPELFPGYAHRRNVGDEHAGSSEQHADNAEIRQAKTYAFLRAADETAAASGTTHAGGGGKKKGGKRWP